MAQIRIGASSAARPSRHARAADAAQRSLSVAVNRLREWSQDEVHLVQSVRMHEPTYRNPAELRRDVREVLDALDRVK